MDKNLFLSIIIPLITIIIFAITKIDVIIDNLDKRGCCSCSVKLN